MFFLFFGGLGRGCNKQETNFTNNKIGHKVDESHSPQIIPNYSRLVTGT